MRNFKKEVLIQKVADHFRDSESTEISEIGQSSNSFSPDLLITRGKSKVLLEFIGTSSKNEIPFTILAIQRKQRINLAFKQGLKYDHFIIVSVGKMTKLIKRSLEKDNVIVVEYQSISQLVSTIEKYLKPTVKNIVENDFYDVFLSYSAKDSILAQRIINDLKNENLTIWNDQEELKHGDNIQESLDQAINKAKVVLLLITDNYLNSEWALAEGANLISRSYDFGDRVFPIIHNIEVNSLFEKFPSVSNFVYADLSEDFSSGIQKIVQNIELD